MKTSQILQKDLEDDLRKLKKNRENVAIRVLQTKYKMPYEALKEKIKQEAQTYANYLTDFGFIGMPVESYMDWTEMDRETVKIAEEESRWHSNEWSYALYQEYDIRKFENLIIGYITQRVKYEVYGPYWLKHIKNGKDGKFITGLLPGYFWNPENGMWQSSDGRRWAIMLPPTEDLMKKEKQDKELRFQKYLKGETRK